MCSNFETTVNNSDDIRQVGKHVVNLSTSVNHNAVHKVVSRTSRGMIFYTSVLLIKSQDIEIKSYVQDFLNVSGS